MPVLKYIPSASSPLNLLKYMMRPDRVGSREFSPVGEKILPEDVISKTGNMIGETPEYLATEMNVMRESFKKLLSKSGFRTYLHLILSYSRQISDERLVLDLHKHLWLMMGEFPDWQWSASLHQNTLKCHWHICVNLITTKGKYIKTHQIWKKLRRISDRHAEVLNLGVVPTAYLARFREGDPLGDFARQLIVILAEEKYDNLTDLIYILGSNRIKFARNGETGGLVYRAEDEKDYAASRIGPIAELCGLRLIMKLGFKRAIYEIGKMKDPDFRALNVEAMAEDYMEIEDTGSKTPSRRVTALIRRVKNAAPDDDSFRQLLASRGVTIIKNYKDKGPAYMFESKAIQEIYLPRDCRYQMMMTDYHQMSMNQEV